MENKPKIILILVVIVALIGGAALIFSGEESRSVLASAQETVEQTSKSITATIKTVAGGTEDPAIQMGFVPHKALYEVELTGTKSGSQIVNLEGQMLYEWQSSCDAWLSNHQFNLFYEYADSPAMQITSDFSTFESFDGQTLDYTSQRKRDGELFDQVRGRAMLEEGKDGEAVYTLPEGLSYALPAGALFPMRHTLSVMEAVKGGKKFYNATVFDGSDEDGPVEINAFIGKPAVSMADVEPTANIDTTLLNTKAWNVRLAFFPVINPEPMADYEMSMNFHENGVISFMEIEYEDFSVEQRLVALEKVEKGCQTEAKVD